MPDLYVITGANGAGKSSVGSIYIDNPNIDSVFDGDKLFMQQRSEFWKKGIRSNKESRILAEEVVEITFNSLVTNALDSRSDFAYEGHFTNDATWSIPKKFKQQGYRIHLIFLGLSDITLSENRVVGRTKEGGHSVDPFTLKSNFYGNMEKLDQYYEMFDSVKIIDASDIEHIALAILREGTAIASIPSYKLPLWLIQNMPNILRSIQELEKHV